MNNLPPVGSTVKVIFERKTNYVPHPPREGCVERHVQDTLVEVRFPDGEKALYMPEGLNPRWRVSCPHCNHSWKPRKRGWYSQGDGADKEPIFCPRCKKDRKRVYDSAGKPAGWRS